MSYLQTVVTYNGIDLNTIPGLTVLARDSYKPAERTIGSYGISRGNKNKIITAYYDKKRITVKIGITQPTRDLLEQSLDQLNAILQGYEKDLIIRQAGNDRKYTATLAQTGVSNDGGSYIEMDLVFETSDHFGYDTYTTTLLNVANWTGGSKTSEIAVGGSGVTQLPYISIVYSSVVGGTAKTLRISNEATGQTLIMTRDWATGDVLLVDTQNRTITVNGTTISYTGSYPEFSVGVGYVTVSDDFTSRTYTMKMTYTKRYV